MQQVRRCVIWSPWRCWYAIPAILPAWSGCAPPAPGKARSVPTGVQSTRTALRSDWRRRWKNGSCNCARCNFRCYRYRYPGPSCWRVFPVRRSVQRSGLAPPAGLLCLPVGRAGKIDRQRTWDRVRRLCRIFLPKTAAAFQMPGGSGLRVPAWCWYPFSSPTNVSTGRYLENIHR